MKIPSIVTLLLVLYSLQLQAQHCDYCQYHIVTDRYTCVATCTSIGEGCGGCCTLQEGGQVCFVGGCCSIVPGVGGVCYDKTGNSCGNFSCHGGAARPVSLDDAPLSLQGLGASTPVDKSRKTILSEVPWIADANFPTRIEKYSASIARAVAAFQAIIASAPTNSMKEYDSRRFNVVVRPGFPAKATVSHATGDKWVLYLDRADTEQEGPTAPILLEIEGNHWILSRAQATPADDQKAHKRHAVAEGTVE
jgi:hypothetical protein